MTDAHVTPPVPGRSLSDHPVARGQAAVEFYRAAFGGEELLRTLAEDGERILHSRLLVNGGLIFLSDEFPEYGNEADITPKGVTLHLQVDDADEWWNRAIIAGCIPLMPLADQFWGDRYGRMTDPFGHVWSVGAPVRR